MTKQNDGKHDTKTQKLDASKNGNFINPLMLSRLASVALAFGLTICLVVRKQYLYSLCGTALAICAATSERLRSLKIGLRGFTSEWTDRHPRKGVASSKRDN